MSVPDWLAAARLPLAGETSPGVGVDWPYLGDSVALTRWRCLETDERPRGEKHQRWHVISFVAGGSFRMRDRTGQGVADCNRVLFHNPWSGYETSHPCGCGDRGGSLVLREDLARELLAARDADAAQRPPEELFARSLGPSEPRLQADFWRLLAAGERGADSLYLEEAAIGVAGRAVAPLDGAGGPPPPPRPRIERRRSERLMRVQELLWTRVEDGATLSALAAEVGVSVFQLCREFRDAMGCTVHRYLTRLRLGRAAELIEGGGGRDLSRLAHELGFSSHSHFSSAFRSEYGLSPSALRRARSG